MMEQKKSLEPIKEESEQDDGIKESKTGKREEAQFQSKVGLKTEEVVAEDESNEEDGGALRSRQLSRSLSQKNFLQMQSTVSEWEEMKHFTVPDLTPYSLDLSDEATSPRPPSLEKVWWCSGGKLRRMVSIFAVSVKIIFDNTHLTDEV